MLNQFLEPYVKPIIREGAKQLYKMNMAPNMLLYALFGGVVLTFLFIAVGLYGLGLLTFLASSYLRAVMPVVLEARKKKKTAQDDPVFFAFMDRFLKYLLYAGFVFFFMVGPQGSAIAGGFLLLGFSLNAVTQVFYAEVKPKDNGEALDLLPSLSKINALVEGAETIIIFLLMCLVPALFPFVSVIYGFACFASAIGRVLEVRYQSQATSLDVLDEELDDAA